MKVIREGKKHVIFQTAPSIRVGIAEEFGARPGERLMKGEMVAGCHILGPKVKCVDTNFSADLTIIEEGNELIERLKRALTGKGSEGVDHVSNVLPMFTSCCPGWVLYCEKNYPELLPNLSTCKSPQQMMGQVIKTYYAKKSGIDPKDIVSVSIMPCTAKKYEKIRKEMEADGIRDIDYALTTREFAKLFKQNNINLAELPSNTPYDDPLSHGTGAAVIFGTTGGVMEAALRTAYEVVTGKEVPFKNLNIHPCRGFQGVKEASIPITETKPEFSFLKGATLKIAIVHGGANIKAIADKVLECKKKGEPAPWHFIEIMACPSIF